VPWSSVSLRSELRIIARNAATYFVGVPDVTTLPLLMFTASLAGNYQIAAITALVLLVPSV
jgi:ABC-type Fe3+ transport system permease subunit